MKNKIFLVLLFLILIPVNAKANSYEIVTYDLNLKINENRTANVKEEYNIYFMQNEYFNRKIVNKLNIIRPDGSKKTEKTNVSNISVLVDNQDVNYEYKNNEILIYSENNTDDIKNFVISYLYDYGKDSGLGYDEVFVQILDGTIPANISSINFKIEFPKTIDLSKIKFLTNSKYNDSDITYNISDNVIYGTFNRTLNENESISMYANLPNNYFIGESYNFNYLTLLLLIAPLITITTGIYLYIKYRKNNKLQVILDDKIPYNFNSAEIAYLYKGYLKEHDLMTIFISLANDGYIRFKEIDDGYKLGTFNSFFIEKVKDYDLDNAVVKILFEKLFQDKNIIELKDIEYNLYDSLVDAKSAIDNEDNKNKLFFQKVGRDKKILQLLLFLSTLIMNFNSIYLFTGKYYLIPVIVIIMFLSLYILIEANTKLLIKIVLGLIPLLVTLYISLIPLISDYKTMIIYIFGMLLIFGGNYIYKTIPSRTIYGNEVLGRITGFKNSLEMLNSNELKEKLLLDPNYYYNMYPYIYVLDLTEKWNNKFSQLITKYPEWYTTKEEFSLDHFQNFVKNMIFTITQAMFKKQLTGQSSIHVEYHKDSIKESKLL